jgi:hypothetical protein
VNSPVCLGCVWKTGWNEAIWAQERGINPNARPAIADFRRVPATSACNPAAADHNI